MNETEEKFTEDVYVKPPGTSTDNGALYSLVAVSIENNDIDLEPEISFFKKTQKRHSRFMSTDSEGKIVKVVDLDSIGNEQHEDDEHRFKITVPRNGDLLKSLTLNFDIIACEREFLPCKYALPGVPDKFKKNKRTLNLFFAGMRIILNHGGFMRAVKGRETFSPDMGCPGFTTRMLLDSLESVSFIIGNTLIEKLSGFMIKFMAESGFRTQHMAEGWRDMVNKDEPVEITYNDNGDKIYHLSLDIPFFFSRNLAQVLPVISLAYMDMRVIHKFKTGLNLSRCVTQKMRKRKRGEWEEEENNFFYHSFSNQKSSVSVYNTFTHLLLDNGERIRFAQNAHEYHITQEISRVFECEAKGMKCSEFKYISAGCTPVIGFFIKNNETGKYVDKFQRAWIKTGGFALHCGTSEYCRYKSPISAGLDVGSKPVFVFSAALNASYENSTGTHNFTKLDDIRLIIRWNPDQLFNATVTVFTTPHNTLRFQSGMGSLRQSYSGGV